MYKPEKTEYAPYYETYVSLVPEPDVMPCLAAQPSELRSLVGDLPEDKGTYAYADGKWTIKEVLSHLIDGERMFAYRVLRISRGDETPIEGFEQDGYIENSNANNRTIDELLNEFDLQRRSNLLLLGNMSEAAWKRMGIASKNPVSARALVNIMIGHVRHHAAIIRDRYMAN